MVVFYSAHNWFKIKYAHATVHQCTEKRAIAFEPIMYVLVSIFANEKLPDTTNVAKVELLLIIPVSDVLNHKWQNLLPTTFPQIILVFLTIVKFCLSARAHTHIYNLCMKNYWWVINNDGEAAALIKGAQEPGAEDHKDSLGKNP